jgi:predicted transcriptional regulator
VSEFLSTLRRLLLRELLARLDSHKDAIDQNAQVSATHYRRLAELDQQTLELLESITKRVRTLEDFNEKFDLLTSTKREITDAAVNTVMTKLKKKEIISRAPDYIR